MYWIKNWDDVEKLNKLVSLQSQVKVSRLRDKLRKQKFDEVVNKLFDPVTKSITDVMEDLTKILTETS